MIHPGQTVRVKVNVTNPGQLFACCGILEVAHRVWQPGPVKAWFADDRFFLARSDGKLADLAALVHAAVHCEAKAVPIDDPKTDPIEIGDPIKLRLDWWQRSDGSKNPFKTWAANATSLQMFRKWQEALKRCADSIKRDPENILSFSERVQGSYGFDSDLCWNSLRIGFSFNEHNALKRLPAHPAVELFGAIGLQRFFPYLDEQQQALSYSVWRVPLTAPVARAAELGLLPGVSLHRFTTRFQDRGNFKGLDTARTVKGGFYE